MSKSADLPVSTATFSDRVSVQRQAPHSAICRSPLEFGYHRVKISGALDGVA
jgi:hypothetical protein